MIIGIQLLGIIFGLIMIYFSNLYFQRGNYGKKSLLLWITTWVGVVIIFTVPQLFVRVTTLLSLQRVTDLYTSIAIIFLTTVTFYIYGVVKKMERKMEKFVRSQAIRKAEQPKKAKK